MGKDLAFLAGGGAVGALMRAHDWSTSPLGPPDGWPQSLRSVVGLMLNSRFPMFVAWGEELGFLYNDPYAEILGAKHPSALGARFQDIWPEIWPDILPLIQSALAGEATYRENLPLLMHRKGYDEPTWFTFSYSPVRDEEGAVTGMFCACTETTSQVLHEQRRVAEIERQRRLFEQAPGFICSLSGPDHVFEFANAAYRSLFGREDLVGHPVGEVFPALVAQGFGELLDQVYETGERFVARAAPIRLGDGMDGPGQERYLDFIYAPVQDDAGQVTGIFCEGYDVTERILADQARATALAALADREQELNTLADNLPVLISYVDADRRYRFLNRAYEDWFPWDRSALLGRRVEEVIGPEAYASVKDRIDRVLAGERLGFEQFMPYADTGHRHIIVDYVPRLDETGQVLGFYGLVQDVTARRAAEAAARESDARFRLMADNAPVMMWVTDPDGHCTYLNARWYEFTGQAPGAGEGLGWLDCVHPDDRASAEAAFRSANAEQRNYQVDFRLRRADGTFLWHLDTAAARFTDAGEYLGYIGSVVDIDARKHAAQELERRVAEQTAQRNRVWEMSRDLFAIMGFDGRLKVINPAWETTLGRDTATLLALDFTEQVHPDDHPQVEAVMQVLMRGEPVSRFEDRLRHADGSWRWISWTLVPEGEVFYAVGRDVTAEREAAAELEQAQEALRQSQKMEAMGQLTGGVAHDFNNLLTPIVGSLDMLQRQGLGGQREQRLIAGALQSADRARTLVQRLLAFARRQPLQATAVDVSRLVAGMADLVASTSGPQIRLVVEAPEGLPAASADPNQLEMALLNLGVNARDAMPGGGTLTMSVAAESVGPTHFSQLPPGDYIRLCVADTGVGMDEATRRRAIEPFFSTKGIGKGTGLGLSMVHGLAMQLGGGLTLDSAPGRGTSVILWLPLSRRAAQDAGAALPRAPMPRSRGVALLVDDEELVRASTADMLTEFGYRVVEATSAEDALRLVDEGLSPDLLVSDHLMPGLTGADLARQLRARRPGLPVLIVSGYAEAEGLAPDLPRLTKPFRSAELAASLASLAARV